MMDTNCTATLYLPQEDGWETVEAAAFWPWSVRAKVSKNEVAFRRPALIFLPLEGNPDLDGVDIPPRSYIVRGSCSARLGEDCTLKELLRDYEAQMILNASLYDFCSMEMRHWELEVEPG